MSHHVPFLNMDNSCEAICRLAVVPCAWLPCLLPVAVPHRYSAVSAPEIQDNPLHVCQAFLPPPLLRPSHLPGLPQRVHCEREAVCHRSVIHVMACLIQQYQDRLRLGASEQVHLPSVSYGGFAHVFHNPSCAPPCHLCGELTSLRPQRS